MSAEQLPFKLLPDSVLQVGLEAGIPILAYRSKDKDFEKARLKRTLVLSL
jgi:hypothetical protein